MLANQYKSTHRLIAHLRQQGQGEETKSPPSSSCRYCSSLCDQVVTPELSQSATLSHCVTISHTVTCHLQRPPPPPKGFATSRLRQWLTWATVIFYDDCDFQAWKTSLSHFLKKNFMSSDWQGWFRFLNLSPKFIAKCSGVQKWRCLEMANTG